MRRAGLGGGGRVRARATGGLVELLYGVVDHWGVINDVEEAGEAVVDGGMDGAVASGGGAGPRRLIVALLRCGRGGSTAGIG